MTTEQFNDILSNFYKLYDIEDEAQNIVGDDMDEFIIKVDLADRHLTLQEETIDKLRNIDFSYVTVFDKDGKLPHIYILFKKFVNNIKDENYNECGKIKNEILSEF